ncbi:MAG: hypothetical protein M3376_01480, partial [Actinomycetota bacterium]|nr:hypothetical protein [Actinomycetota bacterium]
MRDHLARWPAAALADALRGHTIIDAYSTARAWTTSTCTSRTAHGSGSTSTARTSPWTCRMVNGWSSDRAAACSSLWIARQQRGTKSPRHTTTFPEHEDSDHAPAPLGALAAEGGRQLRISSLSITAAAYTRRARGLQPPL